MNPTILHPAMDKQRGRLGFLTLVWREKESSELKLAVLGLKMTLCHIFFEAGKLSE